MPLKKIWKRRPVAGYTMIETLVAASVFTLMLGGAVSMMTTFSTAVDGTSAQLYADQDASIAMQMIVADLREGTGVDIYQGGTKVVAPGAGNTVLITKPRLMAGQTYYNRFQPDTANPTRYYLSDTTGDPSRSGTYLWQRKEQTGAKRMLRRGVSTLSFSEDDGGVAVTLGIQIKGARTTKVTTLTQRVIYMRNLN